MLTERMHLLDLLNRARVSLVLGGVGLGKKTLLRQYAAFLGAERAALYVCGVDDHVLTAFVANFTHAVMTQLGVRLFEGEDSAYAQREGEMQPEYCAGLIAQDLQRVFPQGGLTLMVGQLHASLPVQAFLAALVRAVPSVRFVFSGFETLAQTLALDAQVIGPAELTLTATELEQLGWRSLPALQGIPALLALYELNPAQPAYLSQFAMQAAVAIQQLPDGARLLAAGLLPVWRLDTPVAVLQALRLPPDYLRRFQDAGFPLGPVETEGVVVAEPLLQALQALLRQEKDFEALVLELAEVYGATDPVQAFLLRQMLKPYTTHEREMLVEFARRQFTEWLAAQDWRRIREALSVGVYLAHRGPRFLLTGDEVLWLARAIFETAQTLDEVREARYLVALCETSLLPRQPLLGQVKGMVTLRLGYVEQAAAAYAEALPFLPPRSSERLELQGRLCLCALEMDNVGLAWAWMGMGDAGVVTQHSEALYRVAFAALLLARGEVELARKEVLLLDTAGIKDMEALTVLARLACDLGEIELARQIAARFPLEQKSAWPRMEAALFESLRLFREKQYRRSVTATHHAFAESLGLSRYSSRPEPEYHDLFFQIQVLTRRFLCAVYLMDLELADQCLHQMDALVTGAPFLQRRMRLCKALNSACRGLVPAIPVTELRGYSELELVLQIFLGGHEVVQSEPFAPGLLGNWNTWSPQAPQAGDDPALTELVERVTLRERSQRRLVLRGLGVPAPVVTLNGQVLPLKPLQYVLLAVLAQAPRTSAELRELLFSDRSARYLNVTLHRLTQFYKDHEIEPLHLMAEGQYRLSSDLVVSCDLNEVRQGPIAKLPQVYQGSFALDEPWLTAFVSPAGLREEIVERLRGESLASQVIRSLLLVDQAFGAYVV